MVSSCVNCCGWFVVLVISFLPSGRSLRRRSVSLFARTPLSECWWYTRALHWQWLPAFTRGPPGSGLLRGFLPRKFQEIARQRPERGSALDIVAKSELRERSALLRHSHDDSAPGAKIPPAAPQ